MNDDSFELKSKKYILQLKNKRKEELINKDKSNQIHADLTKLIKKKNNIVLLDNVPLNNKKEKYFTSKNIIIPEIDPFLEISESINDKISPKFLSSNNSPKQFSHKNSIDLSIISKRHINKNKVNNIINFKTTFNTGDNSKLILRKIDLELNDIINKKNKKHLVNLKTFVNHEKNGLKLKSIKTSKNDEVINNKIQSIQSNETFKPKAKNRNIKKNYSQKILDTTSKITRKIIYYNQKHDLISKKNIINLIQKEENSLNEIKTSKKYTKNNKLVKKSSTFNELYKTKSEGKLFKTENNFKNKDSKKEQIAQFINKDITLKTNYRIEDDKNEPEINVDNYVFQKDYSSYLNFFRKYNIIKNDLYNERIIKKMDRFNSFSDLNDRILPIKNNFIINSLKLSEINNNKNEEEKETKTNKISRKKLSLAQIISNENSNIPKRRKSIIEGYLSNYNINAENYFDNILNNGNKQKISNFNQDINDSGESNSVSDNKLNDEQNNNIIKNNHLDSLEKQTDSISKFEDSEIELGKGNSKKIMVNCFNEQFKKEKKDKKEIFMQQKLEKNLSDMNIIFEENEEQERNNNISGNKFTYFSPNNQMINKMQYTKNKDIFKYLGGTYPENQFKSEDKQDLNENNKYSFFNNDKTEIKTKINNKNIMKKPSKNFSSDKNSNYNQTRNLNKYSFKKSNTKIFFPKRNNLIKEMEKQTNELKEEEEKKFVNIEIDKSEEQNNNNINNNTKEEIANNKIKDKLSIKDLSFLDNNTIEMKENYKLIKEFKDKAVYNLYNIVKKQLEEKKDLKLTIENLTKFFLIDDYKKYINILKALIEKERKISELTKFEKVTDSEIIKYIFRLFSDEYSSFYIKPKKDEFDNVNNMQTLPSKFLNISNDTKKNLLSHKRYLTLRGIRKKTKKPTASKIIKIEVNTPIKKEDKENYNSSSNKKTKVKKKMTENKKAMKQFLEENFEDEEKQKKDFLNQKMSLTNELKYQIEITQNEEGKGRFQVLLEQIEALKNDDINEYIKFIHEKYENYKREIKRLINVREKEERINYFINELIDERTNLNKLKKISGKYVSLEDYKF